MARIIDPRNLVEIRRSQGIRRGDGFSRNSVILPESSVLLHQDRESAVESEQVPAVELVKAKVPVLDPVKAAVLVAAYFESVVE